MDEELLKVRSAKKFARLLLPAERRPRRDGGMQGMQAQKVG